MSETCIHPERELSTFVAPYLGTVQVCRECRRELALRTVERPVGLVPIDCGRLGYKCRDCDGDYTSTDVMSCVCAWRKVWCQLNARHLKAWLEYLEQINGPSAAQIGIAQAKEKV